MNEKFNLFLETVDENNKVFVSELNQFLIDNGCYSDIKSAKSGFVVSYLRNDSKKTLATFVFRKTGIKLRVYADHIGEYSQLLNELPDKMIKEIKKSSVCKRLLNPNDCNPKCKMGMTFSLDGETYQKCRYMAFMPTLTDENNPWIKKLLENEISYL